VGEKIMVSQILDKFIKVENEACIMDGKRHLKPFSPNWKSWCVMDSKHSKCAPIVRWKKSRWLCCGAQGVNQKICIPNMIELMGKTPKMNDKRKAR
jgi:hypothetical protein